jgi:hypothetical protein
MAFEIFRAIIMGALPVATFTILVLQWSIASGRMEPLDGKGNLRKQHRVAVKTHKRAKKIATHPSVDELPSMPSRTGDLLHNKVMFFGGGFYGTMAILTYLIVEIIEIWNFLENIFFSNNWFSGISFDLIISFIINSVMNMVAAFLWFQTLRDYVEIDNGWIWLVVVYLGYLAGLKIVTLHGNTIWLRIAEAFAKTGKWLKAKYR